MAENKTRPTGASVAIWLDGIRDEERRKDCATLIQMMKKATKETPRMWGTMVGFGEHHYRYESGREGDIFAMGFASRKPDLVLYLMSGPEKHSALLAKLGRHKLGKCCLYVRRLADVDSAVLGKLLAASTGEMRKRKT